MYRTQVNGKEIILLFSTLEAAKSRSNLEKEQIYKRVLHLNEQLLMFQNGTSFTIGDPLGLIVAQVKKSDLTTIYIEHIIDKQFMYDRDGHRGEVV
ncbi:hypothetical protein [Priestia megaterium]|uniref:hypothetical protein n=1 Tax=Priestia megaterium TaxID=1404 RepID=UPI000BF7CC5F|nr:hypothetical protein [Priestia megaterium]PFJ03196.1 hypothetical protein COI84_02595 [Priestia megaterium]PGR11731.1 hypothetical protein COC62_14000 [Priestia megaterium]